MADPEGVSLLQVISTTLLIVSTIVGGATAYLRLFVANKTSELREALTKEIGEAFARRVELEDMKRRLDNLEARPGRR